MLIHLLLQKTLKLRWAFLLMKKPTKKKAGHVFLINNDLMAWIAT
jgi:hypothetical protein